MRRARFVVSSSLRIPRTFPQISKTSIFHRPSSFARVSSVICWRLQRHCVNDARRTQVTCREQTCSATEPSYSISCHQKAERWRAGFESRRSLRFCRVEQPSIQSRHEKRHEAKQSPRHSTWQRCLPSGHRDLVSSVAARQTTVTLAWSSAAVVQEGWALASWAMLINVYDISMSMTFVPVDGRSEACKPEMQ